MNSYILFKAGVDVQEGIKRFSGKKEIYEKYLYKFPENEYYERLEVALLKGEKEEAFQAAHALKGMTGNLSMNTLYEALKPVVEALRGEADFQVAREQMDKVREQYQSVLSAIEKSYSSNN